MRAGGRSVSGRATLVATARNPANCRELFAAAAACRACPEMAGRRRVLSALNGDTSAALLLVAEAPGARGAERTGIPFCGDASGRNFERLLGKAGFNRKEVFVTNAVICNPQSEGGRNRRPHSSELESCSRWLRATIELVDPGVVAALGTVALAALGRIDEHGMVLKRDCAKPGRWFDRWLVPLYHPSPRVVASHRPLAQQVSDWQVLRLLVRERVSGEY